MAEITGGEAVVRALLAEGVDTVFGLVGIHALPIYDSLYHHPELRHISVRHEQAAAYMADGYARASGRPGVCITTTGPGAANTAAAMGTAYHDSVPILNIMPQIPSDLVDKAKGYLHESKDQLAMFGTLTGCNIRVSRIEDIARAVRHAFGEMTEGRPRPAQIEICHDMLSATIDESAFEWPQPSEASRPAADPIAVRKAARLLRSAERPMLWVGGGVNISGADRELAQIAEALQAPVVTTLQGAGCVAYDHPLVLGYRPADRTVLSLLERADVLLVLGSRLTANQTAQWGIKLPEQLIHVDIDADEIGKNYPAKVGLVGDAKAVLGQLLAESDGQAGRSCWVGDVASTRNGIADGLRAESPREMAVMDAIRRTIDRDAIVVCDQTKPAYWAARVLPVFAPRTLLYPGYGTLGFGLPCALGAKVAAPDRQVVCLVGDGGFQFTMAELATAVQAGISITVLLFNDNAYGILRDFQDGGYGGRRYAVDLVNPDFRHIVEAYGLPHRRLDGVEGIAEALGEALASERTSVIEVCVEVARPRQF